jgi:1-acyl-sn-glycerol-3-phosphate acyltransferase
LLERPLHRAFAIDVVDDHRIPRGPVILAANHGSPGGARTALATALDVLVDGGVIGLYPEGTRSRDGLLQRGNLGAARLAIASGAPIVPVGLIGTHAVQPPGARVPSLGKRVEVRFGEPLYPDPTAPDRTQLRDLTLRLMADIGALCGQPQADRRLAVVA